MRADLEKDRLSLKMQANATNNRGTALLLAGEMVQEYQVLIQRMMAHIEKLHIALNEKEAPKPNGGSVPATPQPTPGGDRHPPAGAGSAGSEKVSGSNVERDTGGVS